MLQKTNMLINNKDEIQFSGVIKFNKKTEVLIYSMGRVYSLENMTSN